MHSPTFTRLEKSNDALLIIIPNYSLCKVSMNMSINSMSKTGGCTWNSSSLHHRAYPLKNSSPFEISFVAAFDLELCPSYICNASNRHWPNPPNTEWGFFLAKCTNSNMLNSNYLENSESPACRLEYGKSFFDKTSLNGVLDNYPLGTSRSWVL